MRVWGSNWAFGMVGSGVVVLRGDGWWRGCDGGAGGADFGEEVYFFLLADGFLRLGGGCGCGFGRAGGACGFPLGFFCPLASGGEDICEVYEVPLEFCGALEGAACFAGDGDGGVVEGAEEGCFCRGVWDCTEGGDGGLVQFEGELADFPCGGVGGFDGSEPGAVCLPFVFG